MGLAAVRGKLAGETALGLMTAQKKSWEMRNRRYVSSQRALRLVLAMSIGFQVGWGVGERQSLRVLQGLLGSRLELTINGLSSLSPLCL